MTNSFSETNPKTNLMIRRAMYDQEEEASRGAVQGWTNCFPPPARGDDKYTDKLILKTGSINQGMGM